MPYYSGGGGGGGGAPANLYPPGLLSETMAFASASGSSAPASGELRVSGLPLTAGQTVTKVLTLTLVALGGSTLQRVGIWNSSLTLVASSSDLSGALLGAANWLTLPLSAPYAVSASGWYYVGFLTVGGTTPILIAQAVNGSDDLIAVANVYHAFRQTGLADLPNPIVVAAGNVMTYYAVA